ncbi:DsbA family protein [Candidatus Saccharibacteria bacterium]|nr:DsbA family protein [Candidatus Saccharibacteria bacterium]
MSRNTWLLFSAICLVLLGGLIWTSRGEKIDVSSVNQSTILAADAKSGEIADHVYGNKDAKVIIFEYGDYQCPACRTTVPTLKPVYEKYKDKVAFVFRHFPLTNAHPNALAAAAVAEAAGKQGKYWQMHDILYEQQTTWASLGASNRSSAFEKYASDLGLDLAKFREDVKSESVAKKIDFDAALGRKLSVTETPTIFVNSTKVDQYYKDGKVVDKKTEGAKYALSDPATFEDSVIKPALKSAGVNVE